MVVLPDHIHAVWTLPHADADFSVRWRWRKIRLARSIAVREPIDAARVARGERSIWQRRFWEHAIRDARDFHNHVEYCRFNPVKHGLVESVEDWHYSSSQRDHSDKPQSGDFQKASIEHARRNVNREFGER
ncbi:MAG: transposase [Hyphomicrobiaceae bacterium]